MGGYPRAGGLRPTARRICTYMTIVEVFERTPANRVAWRRPNGRRRVDIELDDQIDVVIGPAPSRTASPLSRAAASCCRTVLQARAKRINNYRWLDVAESLRRASFLWRLVSSLQRGDAIFHVTEFIISSNFTWLGTSELTPFSYFCLSSKA